MGVVCGTRAAGRYCPPEVNAKGFTRPHWGVKKVWSCEAPAGRSGCHRLGSLIVVDVFGEVEG
jgi:hypothetical protein